MLNNIFEVITRIDMLHPTAAAGGGGSWAAMIDTMHRPRKAYPLMKVGHFMNGSYI